MFKPLSTKVLVRLMPAPAEEVTASGLVLPGGGGQANNVRLVDVHALGPSCKLGLKEDETVVIGAFSGQVLRDKGMTLLLVDETEILARQVP
mgnify:CR=1 FL=1